MKPGVAAQNKQLRGRGKTVEIDESMFGHKRKYNRGRVSEGAWVFGMVERGSGRALTFRVPDRTRETLVTRLVTQLPGRIQLAEIISGRALRNDAATYCRALSCALSCWG